MRQYVDNVSAAWQGERFLHHGQESLHPVYAPPHVFRSCVPILVMRGGPAPRPSSAAPHSRPPQPLPGNPKVRAMNMESLACIGLGRSACPLVLSCLVLPCFVLSCPVLFLECVLLPAVAPRFLSLLTCAVSAQFCSPHEQHPAQATCSPALTVR